MNRHYLKSQCDMGTSIIDLESILRELNIKPSISITIEIKCSEQACIKLKCVAEVDNNFYWEVVE